MVDDIVPCSEIIDRLKKETFEALGKLGDLVAD
jgi:hypothetical protein